MKWYLFERTEFDGDELIEFEHQKELEEYVSDLESRCPGAYSFRVIKGVECDLKPVEVVKRMVVGERK